ncbi:terminase small subunit [Acinetobacter gerneri]|uniref:terminase small subunit n=1 Tax=Acinetobacter gerneri TaxID=202952 RepID=UPI0028A92EE6|nr:terminase small subunit [Acinetobacter gerneri]
MEETKLPAGSEPLEDDRRERLAQEYLKCLNIAKSGELAGYADKSTSWRAWSHSEVQERIAYLSAQRLERTQIDADYVLKRLVEIDQMDVLDIMDDEYNFRPIGEWPLIWRQYVSNIENLEQFEGFGEDRTQSGWLKKIKWPDKVKNLELIGKHVSVGAFKDKVEHTGMVTVQTISDVMDEIGDDDL